MLVSTPDTTGTLDSVPVTGLSETDGVFDMVGLFGGYNVTVNVEEKTAELEPIRISAVGEDYIVSGINFFSKAPCDDCLNLIGLDLSEGYLALTFAIRHPFQPGNPSLPPSAANRLDLNVFDLTAIIAPRDRYAAHFYLLDIYAYAFLCANPDGYTRELANVISEPAALPFFLVVDDTKGAKSTYNKFSMGAETQFNVNFPPTFENFTFDMYLTMGYGASAKKLQRLTPKYYNPEFNRKAAWKVAVIPPGPPVFGSTWQDNDYTTTYNVEVRVWDWQQGAPVWSNPGTFADAPSNYVFASSNVASVTTPISGTGKPSDPLIFLVPIANEWGLPAGDWGALVKVTDKRAPASNWATAGRDFIIDTPDGIALNNYKIPEYATYQTFIATVLSTH
jgi:hypothetical protein